MIDGYLRHQAVRSESIQHVKLFDRRCDQRGKSPILLVDTACNLAVCSLEGNHALYLEMPAPTRLRIPTNRWQRHCRLHRNRAIKRALDMPAERTGVGVVIVNSLCMSIHRSLLAFRDRKLESSLGSATQKDSGRLQHPCRLRSLHRAPRECTRQLAGGLPGREWAPCPWSFLREL